MLGIQPLCAIRPGSKSMCTFDREAQAAGHSSCSRGPDVATYRATSPARRYEANSTSEF